MNSAGAWHKFVIMKQVLLTLSLGLGLVLASPASAECYADYKAKKDNPLRLHYGVVKLPDNACSSRKAAAQAVEARISGGGWKLLNVLSTFDKGGLQERKDSAGQFYLRY